MIDRPRNSGPDTRPQETDQYKLQIRPEAVLVRMAVYGQHKAAASLGLEHDGRVIWCERSNRLVTGAPAYTV